MVRGIRIVGAIGAIKNLKNKKFSSLLPYMWGKTKCIVMMSMKPSTEIVKFIAPESGVRALG